MHPQTPSLRLPLSCPSHMAMGMLLISLCALVCGCGDGKCPVSGTVRFDGAPVADGTISFVPDDPSLPPDAGTIEDGQFYLLVEPGPKRVEIRASRPVRGNRPDDPDFANLREDYIPSQYNTNTELREQIVASGKNEFTYDLSPSGTGQ